MSCQHACTLKQKKWLCNTAQFSFCRLAVVDLLCLSLCWLAETVCFFCLIFSIGIGFIFIMALALLSVRVKEMKALTVTPSKESICSDSRTVRGEEFSRQSQLLADTDWLQSVSQIILDRIEKGNRKKGYFIYCLPFLVAVTMMPKVALDKTVS